LSGVVALHPARQPDPQRATAIGRSEGDGEFNSSEYNFTPQEILR
jgi:hypothetical protein